MTVCARAAALKKGEGSDYSSALNSSGVRLGWRIAVLSNSNLNNFLINGGRDRLVMFVEAFEVTPNRVLNVFDRFLPCPTLLNATR
jgi:hypothetical protein